MLDVGLYCLRALRGLWGFCVREWLGGFMACGVFAPAFHLLPISFCLSFSSLVFLSCFRPALLLGFLFFVLFFVLLSCLVCSCVLVAFVVVSFSLTDYTRKKGRKGFAPCVLSSFVVCCLNSCIVIKKFRCRCFGFFQFVRLVLPTNTTGVGRLARSYFDFLRHYVDITYNRSAFLK